MKHDPDSLLSHIAHHLIINASLLNEPGLLKGKTGVAIFFFSYVRHTRNEIYEEYAAGLLADILAEINVDSTLGYETGLAGVGYGIEYLSQHCFLNIERSPILIDIDNRIFGIIPYENRLGLGMGLIGLGKYFGSRLQGHLLPNNQLHIHKVKSALNTILYKLQHLPATVKPEELPGVIGFLMESGMYDSNKEVVSDIISQILMTRLPKYFTLEEAYKWSFPLLLVAEQQSRWKNLSKELVERCLEKALPDLPLVGSESYLMWLMKCENYIPELSHKLLEQQKLELEKYALSNLQDYFKKEIFFSIDGLAGLGLILLGWLNREKSFLKLF